MFSKNEEEIYKKKKKKTISFLWVKVVSIIMTLKSNISLPIYCTAAPHIGLQFLSLLSGFNIMKILTHLGVYPTFIIC